MKTIAQGAEAIILKEGHKVVKDRIKKSYRIEELDNKIRTRRTKAETNLLIKASQIINCPVPEESKDNTKIIIPFIDGKKLSEHLDKFSLSKQKQICKQIGESISKLHDNNIIHGDLTTSNMILVQEPATKTQRTKKSLTLTTSSAKKSGKADFEAINPQAEGEHIFFIDFGLGFISQRYEDKAVDLHLLKQALEAKHFKHWKTLFNIILKEYKNSKDADKVLKQLEKVEKRGRYKKG